MENISILSKRYDYVSKIISKWKVANREKIINSIKKYSITKMCKIANVSKSGYYKWQKNKNKISFKEILDYTLVKDLFFKGKGIRGIRRIKMDLEVISYALSQTMTKELALGTIESGMCFVEHFSLFRLRQRVLP